MVEYFVSFVVSGYPKDHFNCGSFTFRNPIRSMKDVGEIVEEIKRQYNYSVDVSIISWQRFENPVELEE